MTNTTASETLGENDPGPVVAALRSVEVRVEPVPEHHGSSEDDVRAIASARQGPVVLRGMVSHWPALTQWEPQALAKRVGDREVTALIDLPSDGVLLPQDQGDYERTMSFKDFLEHMVATGAHRPCYLAYSRASELFDDADYDFRPFRRHIEGEVDTRAWVGSAGTRSMLHSDLKDNFFCQIYGSKDVALVTWDQSGSVYPFPDNLVNSQLDLARPDLKRFPRLRDATVLHATMRPGDMLYMPRGTWHDIRSRSASVSLNHWFGPQLATREYLTLLARLGPRAWWSTAHDFVANGVFGRPEQTNFFFSPPSTGRRLFDLVRRGEFSRQNDPSKEDN